MRKIKLSYIIIGFVLILAFQFIASNLFSAYVGTDDQALDVIHNIAPDYKPWIHHLIEFENPWMESLMFGIQATIGLAVISYYLLKQNKKTC